MTDMSNYKRVLRYKGEGIISDDHVRWILDDKYPFVIEAARTPDGFREVLKVRIWHQESDWGFHYEERRGPLYGFFRKNIRGDDARTFIRLMDKEDRDAVVTLLIEQGIDHLAEPFEMMILAR